MKPIRPTTDEARKLARDLIAQARFAALAYHDPETATPMVSRVALVADRNGHPISLMSDLSHHTNALRADPSCALLIGEPETKGDPLTHPRLSLRAQARFHPQNSPDWPDLARDFLTQQPKAKLYIGFADFALIRFDMQGAHLNGGFGKAFHLTAQDLTGPMSP